MDDAEMDRLAEEASGAGEEFANKTLRSLIEAEIERRGWKGEPELEEYFWEGIFDQL